MNLFGFYSLSSVWLLSLIVPLVLFYFLKLKRPRLRVPSIFLWRQVIEDNRVNSPFQRFKRNLLLLLQLILLMLLILAALQPYWRQKAARVHRFPILIDCSASMAARDKPGGTTRLEAAKEKVKEVIDGLLPDQQVCLVRFSGGARRLTGFTDDKRTLREALERIRVEDVPSRLEDALRMTQALAQGAPFDEAILISDGNFPARADFELSFSLNYQQLTPGGANLGITALNAKRTRDDRWDIFVQVEGSSDTEVTATIELAQDGDLVASDNVTLARGQSKRMISRVRGDEASHIRVKLVPDGFDSLASDNVAYLELPRLRPLSVYVPTSMHSYRHALEAIAYINLFPAEGKAAPETSYDLVLTDRPEDLARDALTSLSVGLVPPELEGLISIGQQGTQVVDWRRDSSLLQHVELTDLVILDQPRAGEEVREEDYENRGYEVLAHGTQGPLLLEKREAGKLSFHLLFHSDRSTLPYRVGFPILISNLVEQAMHQAGLDEARAGKTGVLPPLALSPNRSYQVKGPQDMTREESSDAQGTLAGIPAPHVGKYRISGGGSPPMTVGASLLSTSETTLASVEEILFDEELSVTASAGPLRTDRSLWPFIAALAFCVLLGEWWYFQRRPGGYRR